MAIYKEYNHTIRITGENRNDEVINLEFQSYDKSVAKLVLDLYSENGLPINLTGASVHFLLVIDENQSIEILGTIEDLSAGKVSMEIPQQIKGYNGRVKCGVYIDFSNGSKIDVRNLIFDLEKSLIDNVDYTPIKGNLFQTFDLALTEIKNYMNDVKRDTVSYADAQKSAMLAKTNEVKAYGDNQKTQIGQVLPDVQSKVAAINTELAKIDENMPDLFVAYANSADGSVDFSRAKPKENLWEQSKTVDGWFEDDGTLTNTYSATQHKIYPEYIRVNPNDIYYLTFINPNSVVNKINSNKIIFLDENKRIVDKIWVILNEKIVRQIKIPVPSNARYMRVGIVQGVDSYDSSIKIKLEKSDTPTIYLPSKYDNYRDSFMKYIGYGVKNSDNPSDYRWQVNPEWQRAQLEYEKISMLKDKFTNALPNGDFRQGSNGFIGLNATLNYSDGAMNIIKNDSSSGLFGFYRTLPITKNHVYYAIAIAKTLSNKMVLNESGTYNYIQSKNYSPSEFNTFTNYFIGKGSSPNLVVYFPLPDYSPSENTVYVKNITVYDLTTIFGDGNEPSLEEFERLLSINVNSPTIYSQSILKAELNSNPINSILTTLSAENPSTTLGGTWKQLGNENKFNQTIYYWQRTQ